MVVERDFSYGKYSRIEDGCQRDRRDRRPRKSERKSDLKNDLTKQRKNNNSNNKKDR